MNFDELKKQWDTQFSENVKISKDFENHKEANTIIDKVRKTLRNDFFLQLTSIPLLLAVPYLIGLNNQLIWWVVICYCATIIIPVGYIFRFYKRSYKLEYNSLKNINWFYYNYKSSIDIFSIYTLIVCVLMIMFLGIVCMGKNAFLHFENTFLLYVYIISTLLIYVATCIFILKWWINKLYKKQLLELEAIINELES